MRVMIASKSLLNRVSNIKHTLVGQHSFILSSTELANLIHIKTSKILYSQLLLESNTKNRVIKGTVLHLKASEKWHPKSVS